MVKGISRRVIVIHAPDRKLFEQAIFILREDVPREGVTDEMLLREAKKAAAHREKPSDGLHRALWAFVGALVTSAVWLIVAVL